MVQADPVRPVRNLLNKELLGYIRNARKEATNIIREHLKTRPVDTAELDRLIKEINDRQILRRIKPAVDRFYEMAYRRGIDWTVAAMSTAIKPEGYELAIAASFNRADMQALDNLRALNLSEIRGITEEMSQKITRHLYTADRKGLGVTRMAEIVHSDYNTIGMTNAQRLVRTSMTQAYNMAAHDRISQYAPFKEWIATRGDGKTRPSHARMDGVIIPSEDPFEVPEYRSSPKAKPCPKAELMYPGDQSRGANICQIISCRCTIAPRFLRK